MTYTAELRVERIEELGRAGHDIASYADLLVRELRALVPHAAACVVTTDPATGLLTGTYKSGDLAGVHVVDDLWARLEYGSDDPTRMSVIAEQPLPAAACSHLPGGANDSVRMRDLVAPGGYHDELRMVARDGEHSWGGVNLFRADHEDPFDHDEVVVLASLSRSVANGLRTGLVAQTATGASAMSSGPVVLVVGDDAVPRKVTAGADDLLREMTEESGRSPAESIIQGLVSATRRFASGESSTLPSARLRCPSGRWLVAHGAPLSSVDAATTDVAIVIDEARPPEIISILGSSFGLTAREREVTELVLGGTDTKGIAEQLSMSAYTVQDHLKSVFDKAGVRSRRELMARVFFDQYAPRLSQQVGVSGWFG